MPDDNYFHLAPDQERKVVFTGAGPFKAHFEALNWNDTLVVRAAA
jgi:hypothetical protein